MRLLESGEIPHQQLGRHRRIALTNLPNYQARIQHARRPALDEMAAEAGTDDLHTHSQFQQTR